LSEDADVAVRRFTAERVIQRQARPDTRQAFYGGMRLMGVDSVVDVPETSENERAFGRSGSGRSPGAFPQARVLSLCELGTHVLWKPRIKPLSPRDLSFVNTLKIRRCRRSPRTSPQPNQPARY
jgi:hypothetical protein